jgi:abortive infection alpha-like protein
MSDERESPDPLDDRDDRRGGNPITAAPGMARLALGAWWRATGWGVETTARTYGRILQSAASGESASQLLDQLGKEARHNVRRLLEIPEVDELVGGLVPTWMRDERRGPPQLSLRDRGAELLLRSADVRYVEKEHPAYEQILEQLAPDEARILRLLHTRGSQPAVDVRTWFPLTVGSQLVARGLTMIGPEAGCRYAERVPAYLNNLNRLGLIWVQPEPLDDIIRYQVLEAQPHVIEAMKSAGRGRTVRRSIHLTPFGTDFCDYCLPQDTEEFEAVVETAGEAAAAMPDAPGGPAADDELATTGGPPLS